MQNQRAYMDIYSFKKNFTEYNVFISNNSIFRAVFTKWLFIGAEKGFWSFENTYRYIFRHCERIKNDGTLNEPILERKITVLTTEIKIFPIINT